MGQQIDFDLQTVTDSLPSVHVAESRRVLDGLCSILADLTGAQMVVVDQLNPQSGQLEVKGKRGTAIKKIEAASSISELNAHTLPALLVPDVNLDTRFKAHGVNRLVPKLKCFIAMLLPDWPSSERAALKIINPRRSVFIDDKLWRDIGHFARVCSDMLKLEKLERQTALASASTRVVPASGHLPLLEGLHEVSPADAELAMQTTGSTDPSAAFLFDTLVRKRVLHNRKGVDYLTLRSWRSALKSYQVSAMINLKEARPAAFVQRAADEIASEIICLHGAGIIESVVPVPGGSSGPRGGFSEVLAREVAYQLDASFCNVLAPQGRPGSSSPRKSANLKPYDVHGEPKGPILVVDDVVSSGTHIELAVKALRQKASAVYGVAWIGN
jgi:hypoxanthine-guanine phosphoribosyltransferase